MDAPAADYSIPGMRIRPTESGELLVQSSVQQDWVEELPTVVERISNPRVPTAIHYQNQFYRIDSVEQSETGWIYRMTPWPENELRLNTFELDADHIRTETADTARLKRDVDQAHVMVVWAWLLGWLPSPIQNRLAERINFSPADASRVEAFVQMALGLGLTWLYIMAPPYGWLFFLATLEGGFRWMHCSITQEPIGFWPLEAATRLIRRFIT
ncbi:hypothetical protein LLG95_11625 [bacterium]|nr:hypothetical protein [bacterium]